METHYSWRRELQPTPKLHHLCYVPWGGGEALIYRGKDKKTKTSGTGRKTVKPEDGNRIQKKKKVSLSQVWSERAVCAISRITSEKGAGRTVETTPQLIRFTVQSKPGLI